MQKVIRVKIGELVTPVCRLSQVDHHEHAIICNNITCYGLSFDSDDGLVMCYTSQLPYSAC